MYLSLRYGDRDRRLVVMLPSKLSRVMTTLAAWLAAFLIVTAILTLFGDELTSLPLALRALVMSGVLVILMTNLVMPVVSAAIARWT
jgi:antibiotic biosynthesis monooxygenase (ABM) superfamily enzyme